MPEIGKDSYGLSISCSSLTHDALPYPSTQSFESYVSSHIMYKSRWILLIIFLAGLILLLLPDNGSPVIRLNQTHGPSFLDLAGLALMLGSWLVSTIVVIRHWNQVTIRTGRYISYFLLILYLLSIFGTVIALSLSVEWVLWTCVAFASAINIFFIVSAFRLSQ